MPGPRRCGGYPRSMTDGHVASLRRWPVKSMAGEELDALALDRWGATGDRAHAVFAVLKGAPRRVNAEAMPRLLAWAAAYPAGSVEREAPPQPLVTAPDGTSRAWEDPELPAALAADLGREVTLRREPRGQQDRPATVHVTVEASLRALGETLGAPVDLARFRSNIHLDLDAEPYAEERWLGRRLRIGDADLEIVEGCERCAIPTRDPQTQEKWPQLLRFLAAERATTFGLIARPLGDAIVRRGDTARLL
jgi:uncharacterized protein YcbX